MNERTENDRKTYSVNKSNLETGYGACHDGSRGMGECERNGNGYDRYEIMSTNAAASTLW